MKFVVGNGNWGNEIREQTTAISPAYWTEFQPLGASEIAVIERETNRKLPEDFTEFLKTFGFGRFPGPFYGGFWPPNDILTGCIGALTMALTLADIKDVSHEAIRRLYISRGAENPAPDRITEDVFLLDDLNVLDLFIVGDDGACGYHALFVGRQPGPLGYCNIAPGPSIVDRAKDFSEGLELMFASHSRIQELRRQR